MAKRKNSVIARKTGLDSFSAVTNQMALTERRGRGRRAKMPASEIIGRANNYRGMFWLYRLHENKKDPTKNEWVRDQPRPWVIQLLASKNAAEAEDVLECSQNQALRPLAPLILKVLGERSFPKMTEKKVDFLADSLAGVGVVSPRRSRDICARARSEERAKSPYKIIRHEYYVECECGFKGPACDNACRKCGAEIPFLFDLDSGLEFP